MVDITWLSKFTILQQNNQVKNNLNFWVMLEVFWDLLDRKNKYSTNKSNYKSKTT